MTTKSTNSQPQNYKKLQCGNWMQKKLVNTLRERRKSRRRKPEEKNFTNGEEERKKDENNGKP